MKFVSCSILSSILLVLAVTLSFLFVQTHIVNNSIRYHEEQFNENQLTQVRIAAHAFEDVLSKSFTKGQLFAAYSLVDYCNERRSKQSIETLFQLELDNDSGVVAYSFLPVNGRECKPVEFASADKYGVAAQQQIQRWAKNSDVVLFGKFNSSFPKFYLTEEFQFIGTVYPVSSGGDLYGQLFVVYNLGTLIDRYIAPMRSGKFGAGYLLSGDGTIVYDHEAEIIGRNVFDGIHDPYPDLLTVDRRLVLEASGKGEYSFTVERDGKTSRKLIAWYSLQIEGQKLVICLSAPDIEIDVALKDVRAFQMLAVVLMTALIAFLFFYFFRRNARKCLQESEERLKLAFDGNRDGVWDWDLSSDTVYYSNRLKAMLGYSGQDAEGLNGEGMGFLRIHPDDQLQNDKDLQGHLSGKTEYYENEHRLLCKDGSYKWVLDRGKVLVRNRKGEPLRMLGTFTDIEDKKAAEREILKLSTALEHCPSSVVITNGAGVIEYANIAFEKITGFTREEAIGQRPALYRSNKHPEEFYTKMWSDISAGRLWHGEVLNTRKDGSDVWNRLSISPLKDGSGVITHYVGVMDDISDLKNQQKELRELALTDELTGVGNRRRFMELATYEYRRALRFNQPLCFVVFDIDDFKNVNDTYGHDVGDIVLREVTKVVMSNMREVDTLARIGGEEFAIILPEVRENEGVRLIEALRRMIHTHQFNVGESVLQISVSFGVSEIDHRTPQGVDGLLKEADEALYAAKRSGKNSVTSYIVLKKTDDF